MAWRRYERGIMMKADGARKLGMSQAGYTKRLEAALKREAEKEKSNAQS